MKEKLGVLKSASENLKLVFKPEFYRLSIAADKNNFLQLVESQPFLTDDVYDQLKELIRSRFPSRTFQEQDYKEAVEEHLGTLSIEEYGVWVYYPWSKRLVHLLDKEEFIELRTSRNKHKITDKEEEILATKKVGVVGLSVGQSVSMTLCTERVVGEIRIADFDILELTNLNRIRSGVHNLGLLKTVMVAREIAEIDPFLKVTPFHQGLTQENMDQFFTEGGQLDLIIDECDGLDMKILLRQKAKSLSIPVLMEASDRGTVDVERYDLEPERPLLHGFIDHLDASKIGSLTNEEKLPFILPMLGQETISARLKASMVEMGQTITTWPQLASAVTLGGAICADICRRILLDQFNDSGRYFIDIEELVGNKTKKISGGKSNISEQSTSITSEAIAAIDNLAVAPSIIPATTLENIVSAALLAPSAGNMQPWLWYSHKGNLYLFYDRNKSASWINVGDSVAGIAFGAALENVFIKSASLGYEATYKLFPDRNYSDMVAFVNFKPLARKAEAQIDDLAAQISIRHTNRKKGDSQPINHSLLEDLQKSFPATDNALLTLTQNRNDIEKLGKIVGITDKIMRLHGFDDKDIFKQYFWPDFTAGGSLDEGIDVCTLEISPRNKLTMQIASDNAVVDLLKEWKKGSAFEKLDEDRIRSSSAIGIITIPSFELNSFVACGSATERFWLNCSLNNIALHPIPMPVFLFNKINHSNDHGLDEQTVADIRDVHNELSHIFPKLQSMQGAFLFRLSNTDRATCKSHRRSIHEFYTAL